MSMYIIEITPATIDLIAALNRGVHPLVEENPTFFVLKSDGTTTIIDADARAEVLWGLTTILNVPEHFLVTKVV